MSAPPLAQVSSLETDETAERTAHGRFETLARILRSAGALAFVAGVSAFLFQHWDRGNDVHRYLLLLAQSVAITLAGLACGLWMREAKGARTLLGLALLTVPVQYSVLGSLLYSRLSWASAASSFVPEFATWVAPSAALAVALTGASATLLSGISALCFSVLARERARTLTGAFAIANALLLLPVRDPNWLALLLAAAMLGLTLLLRGALRRGIAVRTTEGRYARALLCLPIVLLAGRSIGFYTVSTHLWSVLLGGLAVAQFHAPAMLGLGDLGRRVGHASSACTAGLAWWLFTLALRDATGLPAALQLPVLTLPFALFLGWVSLHLPPASGAACRRAAGGIAVVGGLVNVVSVSGLVPALLCTGTGLAVIAYGYLVQQRVLFALGVLALLAGIVAQLELALRMYTLGSALSLGLLGIATILLASLVERHHRGLTAWISDLRTELGAWES